MLLFQRKYFEGSIYVNNYLDVIASVFGSLIAWAFYDILRIRWSFVLSLSISLIGCVLVLIFQEGYVSSAWVEPLLFFGESSPHEPGTAEDEAHYRNYCIPMILFIAYVGFQITFQNVYYASYSDNCIFPFYKRVTANGIVQIVARSVTVGASVAAELPRPWPAYILISLTGLALITAFFLPGYDYEEEFDAR